ncbi:MAG TPA: phosphate/phosphite/phosphonate ABC transporter substrate-binding protein [Firmicutes bacterium]|nr:phosphate/phosphite/phosphonate ABC transporter substrate-binding protein [Bacillota bacterium]
MNKIIINPLTVLIALLFMAANAGCPAPVHQTTTDEDDEKKTSEYQGPIRIAFVPSVEAGAIESQIDEFNSELSELLGREVKSSIVISYTACIEQMAAGHFEAAMLPSLAYVLANDRYGVKVALKAVRKGSPTYRGEIITRIDSGINTIEDLRGKTFGFTEASSTSGHLYPKTLLLTHGIDPDTDLARATFVGDHTAVVQAVLQGRINAGACFDDARLRLVDTYPEVMDQVKVVAYTPDIPSDTFSVRKDFSGPLYDELVNAIMELSKQGKEGVLFAIYEIEEFVPAKDSDYDPIRQMVSTLELDIESELQKGG